MLTSHSSKLKSTGMYKQPIEAVARGIRYDPLPDEIRTIIVQSWRNFGLLPEAAIQQMVPESRAAKELAGDVQS
jgi:hypothetical protein